MPYTHRYLLCLRASSVQTWNLESIIYINNRATNTSTWQFQCAITKVCYRKGLLSQTAGGCQFSSIKLQKLENPFALCTLPGVRSPVPLALPLKSGGARAPTEYMALVPLRHSVKYIFFKFRSDSATGENCSHQSFFPVYRELTT